MGIKDYSSTADNNADVSGVAGTEIAEDSAPSAFNNALRQVMADLATDLVVGGNFAWELFTSGASLTRVELSPAFDDSTTVFTMTAVSDGSPVVVSNSEQVRAYLGGARQEPGVHYSATSSTFTFFTAPKASDIPIILASIGEDITPPVEEYLLFNDNSEHMFVVADPTAVNPDNPELPAEQNLGLHLLEPGTNQ
jgi:hypothetical protein